MSENSDKKARVNTYNYKDSTCSLFISVGVNHTFAGPGMKLLPT